MKFKTFKTIEDFEKQLAQDFYYEKLTNPAEFVRKNSLADPTSFLLEHKTDFISCVCENLVDDHEFYAAYLLKATKNDRHEIIPIEKSGRNRWHHQWKQCFTVVGSPDGIQFSRYFFQGLVHGIFE